MEVATKIESPAETNLALAELALLYRDEDSQFITDQTDTDVVPTGEVERSEESEFAELLFEQIVEELELNESQSIVLQNLMVNAGEWLPYAAITRGIDRIESARRKAARNLITQIGTSHYCGHLESKGSRISLRHRWLGPALDPSHVIPKPEAEAEYDIEADIMLLSQYGIGLTLDTRRRLDVDGATLDLDEHAVSTVIAIANRAGRTTFRELEQDPTLKDLAPRRITDKLTESLQTIEAVLTEHGVAFRNLRIPAKDRSVIRSIALGDFEQTQADTTSELPARERRELRLAKFMDWAKQTAQMFPEWSDKAACSGEDIEVFFQEGAARNSRKAKAQCRECPVSMACLASALINEEQYGVFGGLTARQRKAVINDAMRHGVQSASEKIAGYQS